MKKYFPHDERYHAMLSLLRKMRKDAGLNQTQLATSLNRPQSFVSKYELGERRVDPIEIYEICKVLGVSFPRFAARLDARLKRLK